MLILIAAFTFGAVALLILGITIKSEREIIQERLQRHTQFEDTGIDIVQEEMSKPFNQRVMQPFLRNLAGFVNSLTPSGTVQTYDDKLETAGRPWGLGGLEFVGLKVLSVAAFAIAGIALVNYVDLSRLLEIAVLGLTILIGLIFPDFNLQGAINTRQNRIRKVLPDTLDMLLVSVEAGLGLDGAMQKVIEKMRNPLSDELYRALLEIQVGKVRADALRDAAKRTRVPELSSFVTTITQADQLGVSIANVLRVQSETMRNQRSQRARELAAKLPVKMLFPLVFFIFPALFVVVLAPGAIRIALAFNILHK